MRQLMDYIARLSVGMGAVLTAALLGLAGILLFAPRLLMQLVRWTLTVCCLCAAAVFFTGFVRGWLQR